MKDILRNIGFDDKEAELYLALLRVEKATVSELLNHTPIERRTIYDVLERLVQKGRASFYEEQNTRTYSAVAPEIILQDLEEQQKEFKRIIPQLTQLQTHPKSAKVEILKGIPGLRSVFLDVIEKRVDHVAFGDIKPLIVEERYARLVKQFLKLAEEKELGEKIIYEKGDAITKMKGGKYRAVEKELVFPAPTVIYGNVVTQYIYTDPLTIIKITSKEVSDTHRKYFEYFWKLAKKERVKYSQETGLP